MYNYMSVIYLYILGLINIKKRQIEAQLKEPKFEGAQGIIFIVGVYGADGTAVDVDNVEETFKKLNFTVFVEQDPPAEEIACLIQAAAEVTYPADKYQYVAFYFAGHGGSDQFGNNYIVGLQADGSRMEFLRIEDIITPLKCLQEKKVSRLFFFDCCQSEGQGTAFGDTSRDASSIIALCDPLPRKQKPKPYPGELVAYATNKGGKSWGDKDKGGIWTYHLCKNLRESNEDIVSIITTTTDDVIKIQGSFQCPTLNLDGFGKKYLKNGKLL